MQGHLLCRGGKLLVIHHLPDHPPRLRLFSAELVTEQSQPHGAGASGHARQQPGAAAVRHQAELAEGHHKAGGARRNHHVAPERQRGARARRYTVNGTDDRLWQLCQAAHQRVVEGFNGHAQIRRRAVGVDVAVVQVLTGTEAASSPGDQQAADSVIALGLFQAVGQLLVHHVVKAVQTLRTVQRKGHHALFYMTENKFHN